MKKGQSSKTLINKIIVLLSFCHILFLIYSSQVISRLKASKIDVGKTLNLSTPVTRTGCTISPKTSHKTPKSHPCLTHLEDRPSRDHTLSLLLPLNPLASSNLLGRLGTFPSLICFNGGPSPSPPPSCSRVTGRLELLVSETSICTCKICQIQNENSKKKNRLYKRLTLSLRAHDL